MLFLSFVDVLGDVKPSDRRFPFSKDYPHDESLAVFKQDDENLLDFVAND